MLKIIKRLMSNSTKLTMNRGALIVLEGCDRCGKTTQCKKLVDALKQDGIKAEFMNFPDRTTAIGAVINDYLERKCELEDHAVHLLFAANRWELTPRMEKALAEGTTLIVDRYSFSGVAFSAAKSTLSLPWCREPERGLLKPDALLYFTLSAEEAARRSEFGDERYEETGFQKRVAANYDLLKEDDWKVIDASKTIDDLHVEVKAIVTEVISKVKDTPTASLWVEEPGNVTEAIGNGVSINRSGEPMVKKAKTSLETNGINTVESK